MHFSYHATDYDLEWGMVFIVLYRVQVSCMTGHIIIVNNESLFLGMFSWNLLSNNLIVYLLKFPLLPIISKLILSTLIVF